MQKGEKGKKNGLQGIERKREKKHLEAFRVHYMTSIDFPLTLMDIMSPAYSSKAIKQLASE